MAREHNGELGVKFPRGTDWVFEGGGAPDTLAPRVVRGPPYVCATNCCERSTVGSVIKKRRKRMAKKKHRKLLKKTRIQRRRQGK